MPKLPRSTNTEGTLQAHGYPVPKSSPTAVSKGSRNHECQLFQQFFHRCDVGCSETSISSSFDGNDTPDRNSGTALGMVQELVTVVTRRVLSSTTDGRIRCPN